VVNLSTISEMQGEQITVMKPSRCTPNSCPWSQQPIHFTTNSFSPIITGWVLGALRLWDATSTS